MKTYPRFLGMMTVIALVLLFGTSCGPSTDPAVEAVLSGTINVKSPRFKALTPEQQAEVLRLAKERRRPILGDGQGYGPGNAFSKSSETSSR